jgi:hypothetical protein
MSTQAIATKSLVSEVGTWMAAENAINPQGNVNTDHLYCFGGYIHDNVICAFHDIHSHICEYPGPASLTIEMLNQLADGGNPELPDTETEEWQNGAQALLTWWEELQHLLACAYYGWRSDPPPAPGELAARTALETTVAHDPEQGEALYLGKYRAWTRLVCKMGREGWPGLDWSDLDQLV